MKELRKILNEEFKGEMRYSIFHSWWFGTKREMGFIMNALRKGTLIALYDIEEEKIINVLICRGRGIFLFEFRRDTKKIVNCRRQTSSSALNKLTLEIKPKIIFNPERLEKIKLKCLADNL